MSRIYFDHAATTPLDPEVARIMLATMQDLPGNPSSIHQEGRKARARIEQARKAVAGVLQASIGEIFFTSCGTESNNMALKCAVRDLGIRRIISTRTEHHAVLHCLHRLADEKVQIDFLRQQENGEVDLDHLSDLLSANHPEKTLVSLMHANNEIGTLLPLATVADLCAQHGALFHSDTVQTVGYYPIDVSRTPIHFLTGSAHKFYGPKGAGFIYINGDHLLQPFIDGGAQERNMRGGTENLYGIIGMAEALMRKHEHMDAQREHIADLQQYLADRLREIVPNIAFNGDPFGNGHYKILSAAFPATEKANMLLLNYDIAGISVSGGSACSSGADAGSHVLDALRPGDERTTIRFSLSHHNTREEVDQVVAQTAKILAV